MRKYLGFLIFAICLFGISSASAEDLDLKIVSETNTTITFEFQSASEAEGYRFYTGEYIDNVPVFTAVSRTFDPSRNTVKFAKGPEAFKVSPLDVSERADGYTFLSRAACNDKFDNDGDGLIDYPADPGCSRNNDTDETNSPPPPPVDTESPSVPTGSITNVQQTSFNLDWNSSTDNVGVTKYNIFKNSALVGVTDSSTTIFAFTGLTCETMYNVGVQAEDAAGNKSVIANFSAITTACSAGVEVAPTRLTTVQCAPGQTVDASQFKNDTRYIDCTFTGDMNLAMNGKQRITIIGSQFPVTQLRGVNDIWIEGRPDAYMNAGPRTDGGDLLQIKRYPYNDSGAIASNITLRWIRFHDNSRPAGSSAHPDGIQVFSGRNIRILSIRMERVDVQGIFVNATSSSATGGGPLENFLVADSYIEKPPTGYYTVIYGSEVKNGIVRNVREGSNSRLSPTCYNAGQCKAENMMDLNGNPIKGYIVGQQWMTALDDIVAKFRKGSPNIAAAFDEVQRRLIALEGDPLPRTDPLTYEVHIRPNHYALDDGIASNYRKLWIDHSSTNTNSGFPSVASMIATPQSTDSRALKKSWTWWFYHDLMIDPSWDYTKQGAWGTTAPEGHNSSHDVGNTGSGGIGWGFGVGTASFQLDYVGGNLYQHIEHRDPVRNLIAANLSKGIWHSVLTELTLGRIDGSIQTNGHPYNGNGRVRTWLNNSSTPIDTGPTNTLQRAKNPTNGVTYIQTLMDLYTAGFYTRQDNENFVELILNTTAVKVGKTKAECLADNPKFVSVRVADHYDGSGINIGPSFYKRIKR